MAICLSAEKSLCAVPGILYRVYEPYDAWPRTIVDYDREPWIMDAGTVRITFDSDVRAAVGGYDIFDATLPTLPVLEPGKLVLEVKFTELRHSLCGTSFRRRPQNSQQCSKYVLCYEKTGYLNGFEYWYETQERKMI